METRGEIEEELTNYFEWIMTEHGNDKDHDITRITVLIPRTVTREDNEMLNKPISMQEVEDTVIHMDQGKSPWSDGLTTNFFHFF